MLFVHNKNAQHTDLYKWQGRRKNDKGEYFIKIHLLFPFDKSVTNIYMYKRS